MPSLPEIFGSNEIEVFLSVRVDLYTSTSEMDVSQANNHRSELVDTSVH
jgi:hypothetical protein